MVSTVNSVRQWLLQQWKLPVPDDWLEACVEWIQVEHQGPAPLRTSEINSLVYEQWLVCDLREIETSCLPPNLKQQAKVLLNNVFNLQINSVLDVGAPFYGQLQKVRGADNTNVEVTATQATQTRWEPKANRMLVLSVTDGSQDVKIMEYRPIQCLDFNVTPGTKIQVSGSILCRMGVMMAGAHNIQVLGGEVDSLIEQNTSENVFSNALNNARMLSENPPSPKRAQFDQTSNCSNISSNRVLSIPSKRPFASLSTTKNQPPLQNHLPNPTPNTQHFSNANQMVQTNNRPSVSSVKPYIASRVSPITSRPEQNQSLINESDNFIDDLDMDQVDALQSQWNKGDVDEFDEEMLAEQFEFQERQVFVPPKQKPPSIQPSTSFASHQPSANPPSFPPNPMRTHDSRMRDFSGDGQPQAKRPLLKISPQAPQSSNKTERNIVKVNISPPKPNVSSIFTPPPNLPSGAPRLNSNVSKDKVISRSVLSANDAPLLHSNFLVKKEKTYDFGLTSQPFTYLSTCVANSSLPNIIVVKVKAIVSTLLSKLESNNGSFWSLSVRLNDGSTFLDVDLTNEFLTSLIGFTARECMEMKMKSRVDPSVKTKLVKALKDCQQKLVELCSILELQLGPGIPKPRILRQIPITKEIIEQLSARLPQ